MGGHRQRNVRSGATDPSQRITCDGISSVWFSQFRDQQGREPRQLPADKSPPVLDACPVTNLVGESYPLRLDNHTHSESVGN